MGSMKSMNNISRTARAEYWKLMERLIEESKTSMITGKPLTIRAKPYTAMNRLCKGFIRHHKIVMEQLNGH